MADDKEKNHIRGTNREEIVDETLIPVVKEQLEISSHPVVTGEVRVEKRVHSEVVDVPLTSIRTTYQEHRQPINRVVDTMPEVRYEGDNLIIPVVREEEVVVKRLVLVEEIHLLKQQEVSERKETVTLRSEEVSLFHDKNGPDR